MALFHALVEAAVCICVIILVCLPILSNNAVSTRKRFLFENSFGGHCRHINLCRVVHAFPRAQTEWDQGFYCERGLIVLGSAV